RGRRAQPRRPAGGHEPRGASGARMMRMPAARARSLLHAVHLVTAVILFTTGLLLLLPGLRARVTGGHSLEIRDAHRWAGVAFGALPAVIVGAVRARTVFSVP